MELFLPTHDGHGQVMLRQLRYAGVLETVRIRKMGFSNRETFVDFMKRYKSLGFAATAAVDPSAENCGKILTIAKCEDWKVGKTKVFLKHYHTEKLNALRRKNREAQLFVDKVCRGHIARIRYKKVKAAKVAQDKAVGDMLDLIGSAVKYTKSVELDQYDKAAATKRAFVKSMKKKREKEEAARIKKEKEEAKAREKEAKAREKEAKAAAKAEKKASIRSNASSSSVPVDGGSSLTIKRKGKEVDGTHVFVRDEQLTVRVGKLPSHWEKKVDAKTGRFYFKNHQTRQTTWIDPRTAETRKKNALTTSGDELPYGWDEAEVNSETYFIDHINQRTHWLHPRLLLEEMREEFQEREEQIKADLDALREIIKDLREKRKRLEDKKTEASEEELTSLNERVAAMDEVIDG